MLIRHFISGLVLGNLPTLSDQKEAHPDHKEDLFHEKDKNEGRLGGLPTEGVT